MTRPWSWLPIAVLAVHPGFLCAQDSNALVVGAGVGGSYYCIVSRCDTGTTLTGMVAYDATRILSLEGSVRWHACPDCDRFVIGEASAQLRYPRPSLAPFVSAGISLSSDPDFLGDEVGLHAGVGLRLRPIRPWGVRVEVRGRQVGSGDHMGEASLALVRRVR